MKIWPLILLVLAIAGASAAPGQIINGAEASPQTPGAWPWHARITNNGGTGVLCNGSLISTQWVLTAAHCVQGSPTSLVVTLGDSNRTTAEGTEQVSRVAQAVIHPSYSTTTYSSDIALLRLATPAVPNTYVAPVKLEQTSANLGAGVSATVTGWPTYSPTLQGVNTTIISNASCNAFFGGGISPSVLCATAPAGTVCQGFSGSPLVIRKDGVWRQGGIFSWGYSCTQAQYPDVYTRVPSFISWIQQYVPIT